MYMYRYVTLTSLYTMHAYKYAHVQSYTIFLLYYFEFGFLISEIFLYAKLN